MRKTFLEGLLLELQKKAIHRKQGSLLPFLYDVELSSRVSIMLCCDKRRKTKYSIGVQREQTEITRPLVPSTESVMASTVEKAKEVAANCEVMTVQTMPGPGFVIRQISK